MRVWKMFFIQIKPLLSSLWALKQIFRHRKRQDADTMKDRKNSLNAGAPSISRGKQDFRVSAFGTGRGNTMGCGLLVLVLLHHHLVLLNHNHLSFLFSLCNIIFVILFSHEKNLLAKTNKSPDLCKRAINHWLLKKKSIYGETLTKIWLSNL